MSDALLVLEDGTAFRGRSFGAAGEAFGEAVATASNVPAASPARSSSLSSEPRRGGLTFRLVS